jgi:hypothetical protein
VKEDKEMEQKDYRGMAGWRSKRSDLNELDVPEWPKLALDKIKSRELLQCIALWRWRYDSEPQAERSD